MARKKLSPRQRFQIFHRDNWTCVYCGRGASHILEIDHIVPVVAGGSNHPSNLVTACWRCNNGKGRMLLTDPPTDGPEPWALLMEVARRRMARQMYAWDHAFQYLIEEEGHTFEQVRSALFDPNAPEDSDIRGTFNDFVAGYRGLGWTVEG